MLDDILTGTTVLVKNRRVGRIVHTEKSKVAAGPTEGVPQCGLRIRILAYCRPGPGHT